MHHMYLVLILKCDIGFADTKVSVKLEGLVNNKRLLKDMAKMSPLHQTSNVEAYHNVIIHFCPKMTVYSYRGMLCR